MSDWQLDRLPGDVRREAENAAQRDGLALHRWLGKLIRETCTDEGVALAHELSPDLAREPASFGQREVPRPPRPATEPIRVPNAARFSERSAAPESALQPANVNGRTVATPRRSSSETDIPPRRFGDLARMPEPRVAEALHVVEARAATTPVERRPAMPARPAVPIAPTAREAIARDIAAVRTAARARAEEPSSRPAISPTRERAFSASPVSPLSTAPAPAAPSPESSLPTTGESWAARRANIAGSGHHPIPRRGAVDSPVGSRTAREAASDRAAPPADDRAASMAKLVEGLRRNELSAIGEARLFLKLMTEHMASIDDITAATGRTQEQVARSLRLLGLSDRLRDLIDRGGLSREQAFALLDADQLSISPTPLSSGYRLP